MLKDTVFPPPPFPSPPLLDNIASYSSNNTLYCPLAGILTYIWWFRNLAPGVRVEVLFPVMWIVCVVMRIHILEPHQPLMNIYFEEMIFFPDLDLHPPCGFRFRRSSIMRIRILIIVYFYSSIVDRSLCKLNFSAAVLVCQDLIEMPGGKEGNFRVGRGLSPECLYLQYA